MIQNGFSRKPKGKDNDVREGPAQRKELRRQNQIAHLSEESEDMERSLKLFSVAIAATFLFAGNAAAQYLPGSGGDGGTLANPLFAQYTTPGPALAQAGMYPSPHYVPGYVGSSWYTYQPLQPHELMYQHRRNYYNYYAGPEAFYRDMCQGGYANGGGGLNKTTVVWQSGVNHMGNLPGSLAPFAKFHNSMAYRRYCQGGNCGGVGGGLLQNGQRAAGCQTGTCGLAGCQTCSGN